MPGRAADPFPIVLGHVRSGTTMLRAMLDSHPEVAVPPESYFVVPLLRRMQGATIDFDAFVAAFEQDKYFKDWQLPRQALGVLRTDPRVRTSADAIAGLYAAYGLAHGKPRYADKTPSHLQAVDLLAERFPNARFLHIVRDGRDVAASVLTMDFGAREFAEAARGWRRKILMAHESGVRLGPERYHEVHYEDLVAQPEEVLRDVCRFFDLEYSPSMLGYHERAEELLDGLRHTGHIQGIRRPPTVGVRNWRLDLTPHQIAVFDEVAGTALDALGYERSGLRRSWRARAEAAAVEIKIQARRTRRVYLPRVTRKLTTGYRRVRS
jgi:Sulfotransferase domain.